MSDESNIEAKRSTSLLSKLRSAVKAASKQLPARGSSRNPLADVNYCPTVSESDFNIRQATRHGFPSPPTVMAYDSVQRLLALGTLTGTIVVLGKRSVVQYFDSEPPNVSSQTQCAIRMLAFKQGDGLLISIDGLDRLVGWNLLNSRVDYSISLSDHRVSCLEVPTASRLAFVGTISGLVLIFDSIGGLLLEDTVPCLVDSGGDVDVVAISTHPQTCQQILIGYAVGGIVLWDLKNKVALKRYGNDISWICLNRHIRNLDNPVLTCISWRFDGACFVSGYDNGQIVFWSSKIELQPLFIRYACVDPNGDPQSEIRTSRIESITNVSPIIQVYWSAQTASKEMSWIYISGGDPYIDGRPLSGLRIFEYEVSKNFAICQSQSFIPTGRSDVEFFLLTPDASPWFNSALDPVGILMLDSDSKFHAYDVNDPGFKELALPPTLSILNGRKITQFDYVASLSQEKWAELIAPTFDNQLDEYPELPMVTGGVAGERMRLLSVEEESFKLADIIVTAHVDLEFRFWDVSRSIDMILMDSLTFCIDIDKIFGVIDGPVELASFKFYARSLHIIVTLSNGTMLIYVFSSSPRSNLEISSSVAGVHRFHNESKPGFQIYLKIDPVANIVDRGASTSKISYFDFEPERSLVLLADSEGHIALIDIEKLQLIFSEKSAPITFCNFFSFSPEFFDESSPTTCPCVIFGLSNSAKIVHPLLKDGNLVKISSKTFCWSEGEFVRSLVLLDASNGMQLSLEESPKQVERRADDSLVSLFCRAESVELCFGLIDRCLAYDVRMGKENRFLDYRVVHIENNSVLVAVAEDTTCFVYSLPNLTVLTSRRLLNKVIRPNQVKLSDDGRITIWSSNREFRHFYIIASENRHRDGSTRGVAHDPLIELPNRIIGGDTKRKWLGGTMKMFGSTGFSSISEWKSMEVELYSQYSDACRSSAPKPLSPLSHSSRTDISSTITDSSHDDPLPATQTAQNSFYNAQAGLSERGERLQRLDGKFADLAHQSEDFLSEIQAYTRKQQQKKWYEW